MGRSDSQNSFSSGRSTILLCRCCSRFRDINQFRGDSRGACCFLSNIFLIGHPLLSTERVSKSRLVSKLQRRKKVDRPYSDIIKLLLIIDTFPLAVILK